MNTLANLKQVLKNQKQRWKQKRKKRGNSKLGSTVGSESLLKLSQKTYDSKESIANVSETKALRTKVNLNSRLIRKT